MPVLQTYTKRVYDAHYASGFWRADILHNLLIRWARERGAHIALADGEFRVSYAALPALVDRAAAFLQSHGVGRGDVVAVQLPNSAHCALVILALHRLGAIYAPVNASYRAHDVGRIAMVARPKVLLQPARFKGVDYAAIAAEAAERADCRFGAIPIDIDASLDSAFDPGGRVFVEEGEADPDALFLLGATSGSTGAPKLYAHTHNTQFNEARIMNEVLGLSEHDVFLAIAPLTHRGALMFGLLMAMRAGAAFVVQREYSIDETIRLIEQEGVTTFFAIPTHVYDLLEAARRRGASCRSVRVLMLAGAPVPPELILLLQERWPDCVPVTGYGASEGGFSTMTRPGDSLARLQSCGRLLPGQQVMIDAPEGEEGEILVRGAFLFCGYYADQRQTDEAFKDGWFRTGDVGRIDADDCLHVTGRMKNVIIRGGMKIQAEEVESILLTHPDVLEAVIVGVPDPRLGERAAACVVPKPGAQFDAKVLCAHFEQHGVAKFKWPEHMALMENLPRNAIGKQDRIALRTMAQTMALSPVSPGRASASSAAEGAG